MKKTIIMILILLGITFSASAQTKEERVHKNEHFDIDIYIQPLWTDVIERDGTFPKTTMITLNMTPVKDGYFRLCNQTPRIIDRIIIELNKNPPTQNQLLTTERSDYAARLTSVAKSVMKTPEDLFAIQMTTGIKANISQFQRRESRSCASGRTGGQ